MSIRIALLGNPNCGKTTLFQALTGSGRTTARLKGNADVKITQLPGVYSLSSEYPEEASVRTWLLEEEPDAVLNLLDGTRLERSLPLTLQIAELGIPMVVAVNMMDVIDDAGDTVDIRKLAMELGAPVVELSARRGNGVTETVEAVLEAAQRHLVPTSKSFSGDSERTARCAELAADCYVEQERDELSLTERVDRYTAGRWGIPIFLAVLFLVYFISVTTLGAQLTGWANEGVFGDGWHLFHIGTSEYRAAADAYAAEHLFTDDVKAVVDGAADTGVAGAADLQEAVSKGSFTEFVKAYETYGDALAEAGYDLSETVDAALDETANDIPDPSDYGVWVSGFPAMADEWLDWAHAAPWLKSLVVDGIIGGFGILLGFLPQMMLLFLMLAFLESCGYMDRAALLFDRLFRRLGLSGKSIVPFLLGTGYDVSGIMATRSIEHERERSLTILTSTFLPNLTKLPFLSLLAAVLFGGAWWVAPSAYLLGVAAIVVSCLLLKKTGLFAELPETFERDLPDYHLPAAGAVVRSMWERCSTFLRKAGPLVLVVSVFFWIGTSFGRGGFSTDMDLEDSLLGMCSGALKWIFMPLGFGDVPATLATLTGLLSKEAVAGTFRVVDLAQHTPLAGYSFLAFNLLCAPGVAAIGAIRSEMGSARRTLLTLLYQTAFAYAVSLMIYQFGLVLAGAVDLPGLAAALIVLGLMVCQIVRPEKARKSE